MADEQSPTVEIAAPTVIISNSSEGEENALERDSGEIAGAIANDIADEITGGDSGTDGLSSHNSGSAADDPPPIVAIAAIEADRDITLASIESETQRERIELEADRLQLENEEIAECRREIVALTERVETLTNLLIPPPPLETATEELSEIAPEPNLTEPSTAAPIVEPLTESLEESVEESPVEIIPNRGRKFIAI